MSDKRTGRPLGQNVALSVGVIATQICAALATVPLILHYTSIEAYGVWTIAQTLVVYVTTAQVGLSPSILRFAAVADGKEDRAGVARLFWTTISLYLAFGTMMALAAVLLAAPVAGAFDFPPSLYDDAVTTFELAGPLTLLALLGAGLASLLSGLGRYGALAASMPVAVAAQVLSLVAFLHAGRGLVGVAEAAIVQQGVLVAARLFAVRDFIALARPQFLDRVELREIGGFSARLQLNAVASLTTTQLSKLLTGLAASTAAVGQLGVATQIVEGGRAVASSTLNPITTRLSVDHGAARAEADALLWRLDRLWAVGIIGYVALGLGAVAPLIDAWLGPGHGTAAVFAILLILGHGSNLLTGTRAAYLRSIGQPGLEARYSVEVASLAVVLMVGCGALLGEYGVVVGNSIAYVAGTIAFLLRSRARMPERADRPFEVWRTGALACALAVVAFAWGEAMATALPTGWALVPLAAGSALALGAYMAAATRLRPSLSNARALFGVGQ